MQSRHLPRIVLASCMALTAMCAAGPARADNPADRERPATIVSDVPVPRPAPRVRSVRSPKLQRVAETQPSFFGGCHLLSCSRFLLLGVGF